MLVGVDGNLHPVPQGELGEDAGDVALDGGLAQVEGGGDLGVGLALGHEPHDAEFPLAEPPATLVTRVPEAGPLQKSSISRLVMAGARRVSPAATTHTGEPGLLIRVAQDAQQAGSPPRQTASECPSMSKSLAAA